MNIPFKSGIALLLALATMLPAQAAVTEWNRSDGGRVRVAALTDAEPGMVTAIVEIDPAPGWKTYWKDPGDAGMPPLVDLSAATNLTLVSTDFPPPEIGRDEAGRFFGYHSRVSMVLKLRKPDPARPSALNGTVTVGLCKDICLPFQSTFSLALATVSPPQADEFMAIQLAKAQLPEQPGADFGVVHSRLSADRKFFMATLTVPGGALHEVAAAPSAGLLFGKQSEITNKDGKITLRYPVVRLPKSLDGASVTLLVKSGGRAMETTLAVK